MEACSWLLAVKAIANMPVQGGGGEGMAEGEKCRLTVQNVSSCG
jgi:hypothetical protein